MKIYALNDVEWWIGPSLEACKEAYSNPDGIDDDAHELSDAELDSLQLTLVDENEAPTGEVRSFRQQLEIELANGGEFPRLFACSDY